MVSVHQIPASRQAGGGGGQMARPPRRRRTRRVTGPGRAPAKTGYGGAHSHAGIDDRALPDVQAVPVRRPDLITRSQVIEMMPHDSDQAVQVTHDLRKLRQLPVADHHRRLQVFIRGGQEIPQDGRHYLLPASSSPIRSASRAAFWHAVRSPLSAASCAVARRRALSADARPASASATSLTSSAGNFSPSAVAASIAGAEGANAIAFRPAAAALRANMNAGYRSAACSAQAAARAPMSSKISPPAASTPATPSASLRCCPALSIRFTPILLPSLNRRSLLCRTA